MNTKLRVGLLLDTVFVPAWALTATKRMIRSDSAEVALVILNESRPVSNPAPRTVQQDPAHWLYSVFNAIDEKLFLHGPNALAEVDTSEIFSKVPVVEVKPVDENGKQHFSDSTVEQIKSHQLDIL